MIIWVGKNETPYGLSDIFTLDYPFMERLIYAIYKYTAD